MCYDLHDRHSSPGPVTDIAWAEKNIKFLLEHAEPGKIILGIPAYGYGWGASGKVITLSARRGARLSTQNKSRRHSSGTLEVFFRQRGKNFHAFIGDRHTEEALRNLAARYSLRGTALWRLGLEEQ